MREPLPDPNKSRPINITGNIAGDPLSIAPTANVEEPNTHRNENKNTPTETGTRIVRRRDIKFAFREVVIKKVNSSNNINITI